MVFPKVYRPMLNYLLTIYHYFQLLITLMKSYLKSRKICNNDWEYHGLPETYGLIFCIFRRAHIFDNVNSNDLKSPKIVIFDRFYSARQKFSLGTRWHLNKLLDEYICCPRKIGCLNQCFLRKNDF